MEGYIFQGGFGFRRRKIPFLALDNTNFQKNSPANIPFYVLEIQKCVNLRKICPSMGLLDLQDSGRGFEKGRV